MHHGRAAGHGSGGEKDMYTPPVPERGSFVRRNVVMGLWRDRSFVPRASGTGLVTENWCFLRGERGCAGSGCKVVG